MEGKEIGKRLKEWMLENELSTTLINKQTKISRSNINDWLRGDKLPSCKALLKLHEAYKIPINYILTGNSTDIEDKLLLDIYHKLNSTNKKIAAIEIRKLYDIQQIKN